MTSPQAGGPGATRNSPASTPQNPASACLRPDPSVAPPHQPTQRVPILAAALTRTYTAFRRPAATYRTWLTQVGLEVTSQRYSPKAEADILTALEVTAGKYAADAIRKVAVVGAHLGTLLS
jgi:hypothetical protein